ncbi:MAG: hypothetical protein ACTSRA_08540 [Promethearchaeota archaeon]
MIDYYQTDFSTNATIVAVTFVYYFLVQITYNYFYGAVIAEAHIYYRGGKVKPLDGFRVMNKRLFALVVYSVFSSIILTIKWLLTQIAKRSRDVEGLARLGIQVIITRKFTGIFTQKSLTQIIAGWAIRMLEKLWLLINYFTLPAIVIENQGAVSAIKTSVKKVTTKAADVFIRETAVRHLFRFTGFMMLIITAGLGALIGYFTRDYFGLTATYAAIIFGVAFAILSGIPAWVMIKNLDITYLAFLYCYITDEEYKKHGVENIPSRFYKDLGVKLPKETLEAIENLEEETPEIVEVIEKAEIKKDPTRTKTLSAFAMITCVVGIGLVCRALYGLWGHDFLWVITWQNQAEINAWFVRVAQYMGGGAILYFVAAFFGTLSKRKTFLVWGITCAVFALGAVIYILLGRPDTFNTEYEFHVFQGIVILAGGISILIGLIAEIIEIAHFIPKERVEKVEPVQAPAPTVTT